MHLKPDDAAPDYTKLLEQLNTVLTKVGSGYADWLELWWNALPPQVESKAEEITNQFDKLSSDVYLFVKEIQELSGE